jgi:hypothetical protein
MIEVKDRIATYPGRVRLIPVAGQANTYDMVRADEPIEVGTPINKALFDSITALIEATVQAVDNKLFELSQRVTVGSLAVGSVFGLYENDILVPYIKISANYNKTGNALVIRLDCAKMVTFSVEPEAGAYSGGKLDKWLTGEFYNSLDTATQSVLPETSLSMGGYATIKRKVFLLDSTEYGFFGLGAFNTTTEVADYFEGNPGRIPAKFNGSLVSQWCRDSSSSSKTANAISTTGTLLELNSFTEYAGIRPAMTLPAGFNVVAGMPSTENVMATAEVL